MHDQLTDRLSAYVDGELPAGERAALEAHFADCHECRAALAELRRVVARARGLGHRPPAADLWPGIAARIGVRGDAADPGARRARWRRYAFSLPQLAAAAVTLIVLTAAVAVTFGRGPGPAPAPLAGPDQPATRQDSLRLQWAATTARYDAVVAQLQEALELGRGRLDTATVRVLEENLAIIDRAITRARRALDADPANVYLNNHLAETMRRKIDLLRRAATAAGPIVES